MSTTQRSFSRTVSKLQAADLRKTISASTNDKYVSQTKNSMVSQLSSTQDTCEPVDYEDFLEQYVLKSENQVKDCLTHFPENDIKIVTLPRNIPTVQSGLPDPDEVVDPHVAYCIRSYSRQWVHVSREYMHYSSSSDYRNEVMTSRWEHVDSSSIPEYESAMDTESEAGDTDREMFDSTSGRLSSSEGPRGSWASSSFDLQHSVGDPLLPTLFSKEPPETHDELNRRARAVGRQNSLFVYYPPREEEETIEKRFFAEMPYVHAGHRILVKCMSLKLELEIEPIFASMALYDAKEKKKVSENFYFDMNSDSTKKMLGAHTSYQDISTLSRSGIFEITYPSTDLYLVVRLEKVLQGDINDVLGAYMKEEVITDKLKTHALSYCDRLGKYRMPLAWTAINLMDIVLGEKEADPDRDSMAAGTLERKHSNPTCDDIKKKMSSSSTYRRGSLDRRSFNERAPQCSLEELRAALDTFRPVTLTVSTFFKQEGDKLKDEDLYRFLPELKKPSNQLKKKCLPGQLQLDISPIKDTPKYCLSTELSKLYPYPDDKCRPIKEVLELSPNQILEPHSSYRNLLFISPKDLNFSGRPGSARNLAVKIQFMSSEGTSEPFIFGRSSCPEMISEAFAAVMYHNKCPEFYDEFKIKLPTTLNDHHLFFTFYHITCQKKTEDKTLETPVGYTWLPIYRNGSLQTGEHVLPIMMEQPPPNYSYISPDIQLPGTKWIDNHKGIFTVHVNAVSTVHAQDKSLDNFFLLVKMIEEKKIPARIGEASIEVELKNAMKELEQSGSETLIKFLPIVFDRLVSLMVRPPIICGQPANLAQSSFETLAVLVEKISTMLEDKNDQHGRNATLLSYLGFQVTLPHQYASEEGTPFIASHHSYSGTPEGASAITATQKSSMSHQQRSTSNPNLGLDAAGNRLQKNLDRACSMRSEFDYANVPVFPKINGDKLVHEEIALQWVVSSGASRESANLNSWFFFELMVKCMCEHVSRRGSPTLPRRSRFSSQFYDDIESLISSLTNDVITHVSKDSGDFLVAQKINCCMGFFLSDLLSVMDRGIVFHWVSNYCKQMNSRVASLANGNPLISLKLDLIRIICSHEHYIPLNLPFNCNLLDMSPPPSPTPSVASSNSQNSFISTVTGLEKSYNMSLTPQFCRQHFLAGLILSDVSATLQTNDDELQLQACTSLHNILTSHDLDDRLCRRDLMARVAYLYLPLINIVLDNLARLYKFGSSKHSTNASDETDEVPRIHQNVAKAISHSLVYGRNDTANQTIPTKSTFIVRSDTSKTLLLSLLWVLKNIDQITLQQTFTELCQPRLHVFLDVLHIATACFEHKREHDTNSGTVDTLRYKAFMKSKLEEAIMGQNTARSEMMLRRKERTPSTVDDGKTDRLRWKKDSFQWKKPANGQDSAKMQDNFSQEVRMKSHLSSEANMIILDTIETLVQVLSRADHLQGLLTMVFKVVLHMLSGLQSTPTFVHIFNTQKSLVSKFPSLFDEETELCSDLCLQLLKHCSSSICLTRTHSAASLYLLMRHNFEIGNNFSRVKMQVTMSLSSLVGTSQICNEIFLKKSLKTILSYAETDDELAETLFPEQVKDLVFNLHMILSDTVKMKEYHEDPEMLLDLMYRIARGYQSSPDLRLTWLANMAQKHSERDQHAEAAMCLIHSAALVAEYLYMLEDKTYLPIGATDFSKLSPNVHEESAVSDDVLRPGEEGNCTGKYFSENGLVGLLEQASSSFYQAGLYECINDVYKILIPIAEHQRDWKRLVNIHSKVHDAFLKIDHLEGRRVFSAFFRVGFYGAKFDDLHAEEFIYKEPALTKLAEISHRLQAFFTERFGEDHFEIIKDSNSVDMTRLDPDKAYVQITYVEPYFDVSEEDERVTTFERSHNLRRFVFSTPFTPDGRAHGDLHEQLKRKTVLTSLNMFPYIKTRIHVVERQSWVLTPIEVAIEDIQKKTAELAAAVNQQPPDHKILPMVLQGCLGTTVNQGPMEIALVFLKGHKVLNRHQNKLRLCFKDFSRRCYEALKKNKTIINAEMREYQRELERNYHHFVEEITPMISNNR